MYCREQNMLRGKKHLKIIKEVMTLIKKAPSFHCPKCDSINFIFREECINCRLFFNTKDYENKPTETDRITGSLIESNTPEGYPIKKREIHTIKSYDSKSGKSDVEIIHTIAPDKGKFTTEDILTYDPQKERGKENKLQGWLAWLAFVIFGFLAVYLTKG